MLTAKNTLTAFFIIVAFVSAPLPVSAQVSLHGGSGLFTVDKARTLGHMNYAVGAYYWTSNYDTGRVIMDESVISVPVTLGWGDRFEIFAQFPSANLDPEGGESQSGMTDGLAALKWNFFNSEKHNLRFSVIGLATLPLGDEDKGLGTGDTDLGFKVAVDKEYEAISWHLNVGYLNHQAEHLDPVALYGAGLEWFAMDQLSVIAEVSGQAWSDQIPWRDDNTKLMAGVRYYLSDWGSVSVGYGSWGAKAGRESPNSLWLAGITIGSGLGKPKMGVGEAAAPPAPVAAPVAAPAPVPVAAPEPEARVVKIVLEGIHFKFDSSELTEKAKEILRADADKLKESPDTKIIVEGHTCAIGSNGYNATLGKRRARSAKLFLAKQLGIDPDRMFVISYGEEKPAHTNETREGRALNRRVDFEIQVR